MNLLYVILPALALSAGVGLYTFRRTSRKPDHYGMKEQPRGYSRPLYTPGKCALCWGSGVLEWLYASQGGYSRGLHACTRCGGSGRGPGVFGRA